MTPADSTLFGITFPPTWFEFGVILGAALCLACTFMGGRKP